MGKSPFYSHLNKAALIVFGVINILFAVVCLYGFKIRFSSHSELDQYRRYSKILSCFTTIVAIDTFSNFIVYCVQRQYFQDWCINNSKTQIIQQQEAANGSLLISNVSLVDETTIFNCSRLFAAEVKFSFGIIVVITFVYAFWASFISRASRYHYVVPPSIMPMVQQGVPHSNIGGTIPIEDTQEPNITFANIPPSRDQRVISIDV
ncbi:hypothetical protein K501DRAFT_215815 [Backusella circina FSU 941]|nr:hypothetical protein K501DRAFT_215815 [Backusella circina FSU 941]